MLLLLLLLLLGRDVGEVAGGGRRVLLEVVVVLIRGGGGEGEGRPSSDGRGAIHIAAAACSEGWLLRLSLLVLLEHLGLLLLLLVVVRVELLLRLQLREVRLLGQRLLLEWSRLMLQRRRPEVVV